MRWSDPPHPRRRAKPAGPSRVARRGDGLGRAGEAELAGAEPDRASVRALALRLLAAQPSTRAGLARRLEARGIAPGMSSPVLDRLEAVGLLDDRAFAEGYLRRRLRLRPRGFALARRELIMRGVAPAMADDALRAVASTSDEVQLARAALRQREYRLARLEPAVARRRAIALLRRLGFSAAAIAAVLTPRRSRRED